VPDIAPPPTPLLDVRDLRVVCAIACAGTTAKAAAILHLTQPAVSRALLATEDKLGEKLFERTPRRLVATPAGERLLAGASRLLIELGDLEHRVRTASRPTRIRLVCECYTAYHWLPSALVDLRRALPELEVALAVEHTSSPLAALQNGAIDVALMTSAVPKGELEETPLFADEVMFVVSVRHALASKKVLTRADLEAHTILTAYVPSEENHWFVRRVFGRARPRLRYQKIPLTEAILDTARAEMGIAVLSEWIARPHLDRGDLVAKRLAGGPLLRPWKLVWRREVRDAALRLHAALRNHSAHHALPTTRSSTSVLPSRTTTSPPRTAR
jgi:LysR family transcriptional regulator, regulator for metE and metH